MFTQIRGKAITVGGAGKQPPILRRHSTQQTGVPAPGDSDEQGVVSEMPQAIESAVARDQLKVPTRAPSRW